MKKLIWLTLLTVFGAATLAHDNSRGKATQTFGDKSVVIEYGRPEFKDRDFSQVPTGTIWRIGADAATTLNTAAVLRFADQVVPAGSYRLLAEKMAPRKWELIVSSDPQASTGSRDQSKDVARVPMSFSQLSEPVGHLTIVVAAMEQAGRIRISWGMAELSARFSVG